MKVETFLIADGVQSLPDGKHVVQGERREFIVSHVPNTSLLVSMPVYISISKAERGKHKVGFTILSERGEKASDGYEVSGEFPGDYISFVYQDILRFPSVGNYVAQLTVDGRKVAKWLFAVRLLQ